MAASDTSEQESADDYVRYGYVDPREVDRLFTQLEREHVRFQFEDASGPVPSHAGARLGRRNALMLFVHREDMDKLNRIIRGSEHM